MGSSAMGGSHLTLSLGQERFLGKSGALDVETSSITLFFQNLKLLVRPSKFEW